MTRCRGRRTRDHARLVDSSLARRQCRASRRVEEPVAMARTGASWRTGRRVATLCRDRPVEPGVSRDFLSSAARRGAEGPFIQVDISCSIKTGRVVVTHGAVREV